MPHLDRISRRSRSDRNHQRTVADIGRLVAAEHVGSRRVGHRGRRCALSHLLRRAPGSLVCARSLRLSTEYIELHAASAFSFLDGGALPEEYIGACIEYGMPAMALLDRDGMYGSARFHLAAKKAGLQAHIGTEITSTSGVRYPLLAETREGYQNLCRLMTR